MCNGNTNHAYVQLSCLAECLSPAQLWPCTGGLTSPLWQSCHRHPARGAHTQVRNHRIMESFPLVQALVKNQSPKPFLFITDSTLHPIPNPFIYQLPTRTLFDSTACCQTLVDQWKKHSPHSCRVLLGEPRVCRYELHPSQMLELTQPALPLLLLLQPPQLQRHFGSLSWSLPSGMRRGGRGSEMDVPAGLTNPAGILLLLGFRSRSARPSLTIPRAVMWHRERCTEECSGTMRCC